MRESSEKIELALNPAQYLLWWDQELEQPKPVEIANEYTGEMAKEADIRDKDGDETAGDQGCRPGWDVVFAQSEMGMRLVSLYDFRCEKEEYPDAGHQSVCMYFESPNRG